MKQKPSSRRRHNSTKSILRLPELEHAKAAVLNSLNSVDANGVIVTPSMSSLIGIVQNLAWPSTGSWFCSERGRHHHTIRTAPASNQDRLWQSGI